SLTPSVVGYESLLIGHRSLVIGSPPSTEASRTARRTRRQGLCAGRQRHSRVALHGCCSLPHWPWPNSSGSAPRHHAARTSAPSRNESGPSRLTKPAGLIHHLTAGD